MAEAANVPLLPDGPKEPAAPAGLRADVQFLRALAIGGVLLFHLWPRWIPFGYLGVDLFFVISGYLMAAIMSRRRPLSRPAVLDFYFRRLKRIVPPFQLVVLLVLGLVRLHVLPLDFSQVVAETWPALGFFSNTPGLREHKYFDMSSKVYFFLHSWSLSVEVQFYVLVPVLFLLHERVAALRPALQLPLVLLLPAASLGFQWTADGDRAHFLLVARVWQFFAGFGAHFAHSRRLLDFGASGEGGRFSAVGRLLEVVNVGLLGGLFVFGIPTASAQCVRLAVVALAALLVGRHNEAALFGGRLAGTLGDVSYSVYLLHWPLFMLHKYANGGEWAGGDGPPVTTGVVLMAASISAGFLLEHAVLRLLRAVDSWPRLAAVLAVGLLLNGALLCELRRAAVQLEAEDEAAPASGGRVCPPELCDEVRRLWAAGGPPPAANLSEIRRLNANLRRAYVGFPFCANQSRRMPTSFPLDLTRFRSVYTCHAEGTGTKNVVVIGNSHSLHNFPGIQHVWRSTYRRLTLLMRNSCMPADRRFQQPARTAAVVDECVRFLNDSTRALEQWDEPVDVVIALFALVEIPDVPLDEANADADEFLRSLAAYFGRLSRVAREVLVVQQSFPVFSQIPVREVELRVKSGRPLEGIGDPAEFAYAQQSAARRRMELLDCGRCVKADLLAEWCGPRDAAAFCPSASPAGLVHFVDTHHPTALSAFRNAQLMLDLYTNYTNG